MEYCGMLSMLSQEMSKLSSAYFIGYICCNGIYKQLFIVTINNRCFLLIAVLISYHVVIVITGLKLSGFFLSQNDHS